MRNDPNAVQTVLPSDANQDLNVTKDHDQSTGISHSEILQQATLADLPPTANTNSNTNAANSGVSSAMQQPNGSG